MNVPLPPIFLYEYDYSKFEVMDGLQRLTAVFDFYSGNFVLEHLEYWKELEGKKYHELPEEIQKGIDRRYISSIILLEETAKTEKEAEELKQIVFERLNSGGEKLTPQETRNALYNGKFNQHRFLDKISGITIEDFLDEYLKQANKFPDSTLLELEKLFTETVKTIYQIFGIHLSMKGR